MKKYAKFLLVRGASEHFSNSININMNFFVRLFFSFVLCLTFSCTSNEKKILVPSNIISERLRKIFPIEKKLLIGQLVLENPNVYFKENMLGIEMDVIGSILKSELKGKVSFLANPFYEDGKFFLKNFKFDDLQFEKNEIDKQNDLVGFIEGMISSQLYKFPIYELNKADFKESLASIFLERVEIDSSNLVFIIKY